MPFNAAIISTIILVSASMARSVVLTGFTGPNCTGAQGQSFAAELDICISLTGAFTTSINFTDVPQDIQFFVTKNNCSNGPAIIFGPGTGCTTAPAGFQWNGVVVH